MGRPYERELAALPDTYGWALNHAIDELTAFLARTTERPLLACGSGGSYTTATFAADLHRRYTGQLGVALTPLELAGSGLDLRCSGAALFTAGGRNSDALQAFRHLVSGEPRQLGVFCSSSGSPLGAEASKHEFTEFIEVSPPAGKDGFLATNSVFAAATLLQRAHCMLTPQGVELPSAYESLLPTALRSDSQLDETCERVWERQTLLVLHGPSTRAAAVDLESKFVEAALSNIQLADYRHFAHGRHFWVAQHAESTSVVAFSSSSDEQLANETLALLPSGVPVHRWKPECAPEFEPLASLIHTLRLTGSVGRWLGQDPGRPTVPQFGRRIYSLGSKKKLHRPTSIDIDGVDPLAVAAISRKTTSPYRRLPAEERVLWHHAMESFVSRLRGANLGAIVFDYDGTLCNTADRFEPLPTAIQEQLIRLLDGGLLLGVATGRGRSAGVRLREALNEQHWNSVLVGYYNGGDVAPLGDETSPDKTAAVAKELEEVAERLSSNALVAEMAIVEVRPRQISVQPRLPSSAGRVFRLTSALLAGSEKRGVRALRSGHSLDILAAGVSKLSVLKRIEGRLRERSGGQAVLTIGDRGDWSGNDSELLSHSLALSVDETSADGRTCWNLCPLGYRGAQSTEYYLRQIAVRDGSARFGGQQEEVR